MWFAKFRIRHEDCWIAPLTRRFDVAVQGIPLNAYEENGKHYHDNVIFVSADRKTCERFMAALKKGHNVKKMEIHGNQALSTVQGKDMISTYFDKAFFFLKPVLIKDGFEYWELGCWERKKLTDFYGAIQRIAEVKILSLKKGFPAVFVQRTVPRLTQKQKETFLFAKEFGYYTYPRKISLEQLAEKKRIPRTTFQSHLRRAETKLMDVVLE